MRGSDSAAMINEFLGSTQVFASVVRDVIEEDLLRAIAPPQLSFSLFKLLKLVALTEGPTLGDVAAFLGVSNAAASKAVDKLVGKDLLVRSEGEKDRRAIRLSLTESSRRLLANYKAVKDRKLAKAFRRFSPSDLRRTADLLDRLAAGIVDHTANPEELCLQCGIYYRERCLVRQLVRRNCFYQRQKNHHQGTKRARRNGSGKPAEGVTAP